MSEGLRPRSGEQGVIGPVVQIVEFEDDASMRLGLLAIGVVALLLSACHRDASQKAKAPAVPKRHTAAPPVQQTPAQQTAGMVEAVSEGKSQAPVALKFELPERPVAGQPITLALAILPQAAAAPLVIEVSPTSAVDVAEADRRFEFAAVDPQQVYRRRISLTAASEGVQIVSLRVSMKHDEVTDTRAFAVPLIVAPAGASASAAAPGSAAGSAPASGPKDASRTPPTQSGGQGR